MKKFEEQYKKHVKVVFDNYNVDHLADKGWNAFLKKKNRNHRYSIFSTFWAKAASIVILISIGGFLTYRTLNTFEDKQQIVSTDITESEYQSSIQKDIESLFKEKISIPTDKETVTTEKEQKTTIDKQQFVQTEKTDILHKTNDEHYKAAEVFDYYDLKIDQKKPATLSKQTGYAWINQLSVREMQKAGFYSEETAIAFHPEINGMDSPAISKGTALGFHFSGIIGMVEEIVSSTPGVSVGFYTEHKLSGRFTARPGITIARQNLNFENGYEKMDNIASSHYGSGSEILSRETSIDISTLEIPINLVFNIMDQQNQKIYVSAGTSTLIYLYQQFSTNYTSSYPMTERWGEDYNDMDHSEISTDDLGNIIITESLSIEEKHDAFSRIDPFGLLNLSAGYSFLIGKKNHMIIEPYVQLPLSTLTSNDLRLHFSGVTLKYQLQP